MGVGDTVVPKRMKKLAEAFYGRADAYDAPLDAADEAALAAALGRNVDGTRGTGPSPGALCHGGRSGLPDGPIWTLSWRRDRLSPTRRPCARRHDTMTPETVGPCRGPSTSSEPPPRAARSRCGNGRGMRGAGQGFRLPAIRPSRATTGSTSTAKGVHVTGPCKPSITQICVARSSLRFRHRGGGRGGFRRVRRHAAQSLRPRCTSTSRRTRS